MKLLYLTAASLMLEINNIHKSFGNLDVLHGLYLKISKGDIHFLVGGNGAGKTTIYNLITGFTKPDAGKISFFSEDLTKLDPVQINKRGVSRTFQDLRIITGLTVKENILLSFKNNPGEKFLNAILPSKQLSRAYSLIMLKTEEILNKVFLEGVQNNLAGEISYGQQKLLTIGCSLANEAQLLLLDEPVAGIDKSNYERIGNLIAALKEDGKTIIIIDHNFEFMETYASGIWYLINGQAIVVV